MEETEVLRTAPRHGSKPMKDAGCIGIIGGIPPKKTPLE